MIMVRANSRNLSSQTKMSSSTFGFDGTLSHAQAKKASKACSWAGFGNAGERRLKMSSAVLSASKYSSRFTENRMSGDFLIASAEGAKQSSAPPPTSIKPPSSPSAPAPLSRPPTAARPIHRRGQQKSACRSAPGACRATARQSPPCPSRIRWASGSRE